MTQPQSEILAAPKKVLSQQNLGSVVMMRPYL